MKTKYKHNTLCIPALWAGMQRRAVAALLTAALCLSLALPAMAANGGGQETFYISTAGDWLQFADNCALDAWSRDRTVVLTGDLSLHSVDVAPVPAFGGVFEGGGHSISGVEVTGAVSPGGLFSVVLAGGEIRNLNVVGNVCPSGQAANTGGIAGENYGSIVNCTFSGTVMGTNRVGGVAGFNGPEGTLRSCTALGTVTGKSLTGGVSGRNEGVVSGCRNDAYVNISGADPGVAEAGDFDLDLSERFLTLQSLDVVNIITDTGGVAGYSSGMILSSENHGAVGYPHVGYNTGGIVGRTSGYVDNCVNDGAVYGRRDVGGIAGQAEPYIELQLSADRVETLRGELNRLQQLVDNAADNAADSAGDISALLSKAGDAAQSAVDNCRVLERYTMDYAGDTITEINRGGEILADAMDRLEPITNEVTGLSQELADALRQLESALEQIAASEPYLSTTFDELRQASGSFSEASAQLGEAIKRMDPALREIESGMDALGETVDVKEPDAENAVTKINDGLDGLTKASNAASAALDKAEEAYPKYDEDVTDGEGNVLHKKGDMKAPSDLGPGDEEQLRASIDALAGLFLPPSAGGASPTRAALEAMTQILTGLRELNDAVDISPEQLQAGFRHIASGIADLRKALGPLRDSLSSLQNAMSHVGSALDGEHAGGAVGQISDGLRSLSDAIGAFAGVLEDAEPVLDEAHDLAAYLAGVDPVQIPTPPEEIDASLDAIQAALKTLRECLSSLNGRGLSSVGTLTTDVKEINTQFGVVSGTLMDLFYDLENPDVDDRINDTSAEDVAGVTSGKLRGSVNHGDVTGDINVGGVAGSMSVEYEFDPENDLLSDTSVYRREYAMKAILQACVSDGAVTARRDCVGSVCGRVDLGLITGCTGLGSARSESGDYAGGIAGFSTGTIRDSFAKCALSGRRYVGGVVGGQSDGDDGSAGGLTANCVSFVEIRGAEEYAGAVSGRDQGEFVNNRFVSGTLSGLGRTSAAGRAEPVSYRAMLETEGLPDAFRRLTLRFLTQEDEIIAERIFSYGTSFGENVFPSIPEKEGCYAVWDRTELTDLRFDTDVHAVYAPYITALASDTTRSDGRPAFLLEGEFSASDRFSAEPTNADDGELARRTLLFRRTLMEQWKLTGGGDGARTLRYLSSGDSSAGLELWGKTHGIWQKLETEEFGSYLRFTVPADVSVLAVTYYTPLGWLWLLLGALAAAALPILIHLLLRRRMRGKVSAAAGGTADGEEAEREPDRMDRPDSGADTGGEVPGAKKRGKKWLIPAAALLGLVAVAAAFFALGLDRDAAAGRLLYAYIKKDALSMELSVSAETGEHAWHFDTPLYRMTVDGRRVVAAGQNGITFWYCDGLVYLDNGRAWTVGNVMPDHTALLEDAVALFHGSEITLFESPGEKIYTIDTDGATARRLVGNLLPWTEISLEKIETARLELVERAGELYALRFTAEGELSYADEPERGELMPSRISATLLLRTGVQAPELPAAVRTQIAAGTLADTPDEETLRLVRAWLRLNAAEPLSADVTLSANCGPLVLDDQLEWLRYHKDGAAVSRIRKNGLTLYYSGGMVTDAGGAEASGVPDEPAAAMLLRLAYRLCMFGEPAVIEQGGTSVYSLTLDGSAMAQLFETVLPEGGMLDVELTQGKLLITLSGNWIEDVSFSASGDAHILGVSAPASLSTQLCFTAN